MRIIHFHPEHDNCISTTFQELLAQHNIVSFERNLPRANLTLVVPNISCAINREIPSFQIDKSN